ncbi:MAG: hypothetical protein WKG01_21085 [Kofleriaceae bacterium]
MRGTSLIAALAGVGCVTGIDVTHPAELQATRAVSFALADQSGQAGKTVALNDLLAQHHVALVFYRGHW